MYKGFFKRILDILVSFVLLTLSLPITFFTTILLAFANAGQPFFTQQRPGKNEKIFKVIKFRTMNNKRDEKGALLPDSVRLTPIGRLVRKTSIDELPQLLNVLKGDMSLIGPRPLLIKYLPYYQGKEKLRHSIRPGITGYAQVEGRNSLNWDKRLACDVYYVENLSAALDYEIFYRTIRNIFLSKDVVEDPRSIMDDLDVERMKNV